MKPNKSKTSELSISPLCTIVIKKTWAIWNNQGTLICIQNMELVVSRLSSIKKIS